MIDERAAGPEALDHTKIWHTSTLILRLPRRAAHRDFDSSVPVPLEVREQWV